MSTPHPQSLSALRTTLDNKDWRSLKHCLSHLPTTLPPHATSTQIATSLNLVRGAAESISEVSSFTTAFETSFETRRALLRSGVCDWAIAALHSFSVFRPVVSTLSSVLGLLGVGADGRSHVGKKGGVDLLTKLWHRHPDCVEIVSALVSLCPGHIDNVSRTMRQRGLVVAFDILQKPDATANPELVRYTLILVGMCAICTPDNPDEAKRLVPAVLDVLERLNQDRRIPDVAQQAIAALANVSDCWLKEAVGYEIAEPQRLCAALIDTWKRNKTSTAIASATSRALISLLSSHSAVKDVIFAKPDTLHALTSKVASMSSTNCALHEIIAQAAKRFKPIAVTPDNVDLEEYEQDTASPNNDGLEDAEPMSTIPNNTEPENSEVRPSTPDSTELVDSELLPTTPDNGELEDPELEPPTPGTTDVEKAPEQVPKSAFSDVVEGPDVLYGEEPNSAGVASDAEAEDATSTATTIFEYTRKGSKEQGRFPCVAATHVKGWRLRSRHRVEASPANIIDLVSSSDDDDIPLVPTPAKMVHRKRIGRRRKVIDVEDDDTLPTSPATPCTTVEQGRPKRLRRVNSRYRQLG